MEFGRQEKNVRPSSGGKGEVKKKKSSKVNFGDENVTLYGKIGFFWRQKTVQLEWTEEMLSLMTLRWPRNALSPSSLCMQVKCSDFVTWNIYSLPVRMADFIPPFSPWSSHTWLGQLFLPFLSNHSVGSAHLFFRRFSRKNVSIWLSHVTSFCRSDEGNGCAALTEADNWIFSYSSSTCGAFSSSTSSTCVMKRSIKTFRSSHS